MTMTEVKERATVAPQEEAPQKDRRHHFTVAEYFALAEHGLLPERSELIEGDIYSVNTLSTPPRSGRHTSR